MSGSPISNQDVTRFLNAGSPSHDDALVPLFDTVYEELRKIAARVFSSENSEHTLQPTALVHEVWLRLRDELPGVRERDHLIALAVIAMRRILTDHGRAQRALKRGGSTPRVTLCTQHTQEPINGVDVFDLTDAIDRLSEESERAARVFELHVLGGLTHDAIAELMDVSKATIRRDWKYAQLWMLREFVGVDE